MPEQTTPPGRDPTLFRNIKTHVPIEIAVSGRKTIDPDSNFWQSVVECTGQPRTLTHHEDTADPLEASFQLDAEIMAPPDSSPATAAPAPG